METYKAAQKRLLTKLNARGWTTKLDLKIPQAISPSKELHVYFHPQAVYDDTGHSLWIDTRGKSVDSFVHYLIVHYSTEQRIKRERY